MTLTTSPAALDAPALLRLPPDLRLTPEQFALVCAENREAVLELVADGRVIAITPTGSETGSRNGELCFQLKLYAKRAGGCPPQRLERLQVLEATPDFPGLSLQLAEIWEG